MAEYLSISDLKVLAQYEAIRSSVAINLFDQTRRMYTKEDLEKGISAEIHNSGGSAVLALTPNSPTIISQAKPFPTSHSIFDIVRGRDVWGKRSNATPGANVETMLPAIEYLDLRLASATARGIYSECNGQRSFMLYSQSSDRLEPSTLERLSSLFVISSYAERDLYDADAVTRKLEFNDLPEIFGEASFTTLDESNSDIEVGMGIVSMSTTQGKQLKGCWGPMSEINIQFKSSSDRSHTRLQERLLARYKAKNAEKYHDEYLASEGYQRELTEFETAHRLGYEEFMVGIRGIKRAYLLARYSLDNPNRQVKLEALIGPTEAADITDRLTGLAVVGASIVAAAVDGFVERGVGGYRAIASIIINERATVANHKYHYKNFDLGVVNQIAGLADIIKRADETPWRSF